MMGVLLGVWSGGETAGSRSSGSIEMVRRGLGFQKVLLFLFDRLVLFGCYLCRLRGARFAIVVVHFFHVGVICRRCLE
jgi:hypothetical protein